MCIGCGYCIELCPENAHFVDEGQHYIDRAKCKVCGTCVENCFAGALELAGRKVKVTDVIDEIMRDRRFYDNSGGGMTLSGGEPLAQSSFSKELLESVKKEKIHTALDTSGHGSWKILQSLLEFTDLILYDLKQMDSEKHRNLTGVKNELILENLKMVDSLGIPIWIRIPLIPGQNDDDANFHALGDYITRLNNVERVDILRYHKLAQSKYEYCGLEYLLHGIETPTKKFTETRKEILESHGISPIFYS
jgi:pyruvate formate lyase activating enzyme